MRAWSNNKTPAITDRGIFDTKMPEGAGFPASKLRIP